MKWPARSGLRGPARAAKRPGLYFFNQVDVTISLYLSCLCGLKYPGGGTVEIDLDKLGVVLKRGFEAINGIFEAHGFPEAELEVISRGLLEVLEQAGVNL